ncbi:ABC-F family ATP-binding cassette domain-containing protein [Fimbriiglobus ruber]|uniref:ATPase components of ABC transporter n=1 Tax=Fimbriiglobus ruber TaxID=1908690 RepID=A0A225E9P5_9BACT|nr:ABC-F family ATP-binding cassette domain-containing protein [Fimbriiglobus ruber]OWK46766.1 ATPase components of ABC transporter [Fimbriiglobus ruber]
MLLMSCTNLSRGYDANPLFEDVAFELHAGDRVGFVGPNGAGKTTLMKILSGVDTPDTGAVRVHAGARLGMLLQVAEFPPGRTLFQEAKSAFDEQLATQNELVEVAEQLSTCTDETQRKQLAARFDRLNEILHAQDAYQLDHKVADVLSGLGFLEADYDREVLTFSGGQQRRLLLAKLLLSAPDVMLLDEPSNHLDIATTEWLEDYLAHQPQGMIVISHDRYFLDKVSTRIFELHNQKITAYPGNYHQYVRLRDERYERQLKEWESQREFIEKQEEYIRRAHYGQLAKQAQSRMKVLDKLETVDRPTRVEGPNIHFSEVSRSGDVVFHVEDLGKRFGDKVLFKDLNFDVQRGKRLGIMGPNGCGKTTLLKILLGDEEPTAGEVQRGHLVFPGYLDQHLKLLPEDQQVIRAVWPEPDPSITEQKMRDLLGAFGLQGEIVEQKVGLLSGGERSRAALAKLTVAGANVLILDEPTNHLDLWACDSLEDAIRAFEGTVIVVSHDRYFLNRVADLLVVFDGGRVEVVYGNYDTYQLLVNARAEAAKAAGTKAGNQSRKGDVAPSTSAANADTGALGKTKRKRKYPYRKVAELEVDVAKTEAQITALEASLVSPEIYKDGSKVTKTMNDLEAAKTKLAQLYEHWEEAVELNG